MTLPHLLVVDDDSRIRDLLSPLPDSTRGLSA
jgi:hypothetical protein